VPIGNELQRDHSAQAQVAMQSCTGHEIIQESLSRRCALKMNNVWILQDLPHPHAWLGNALESAFPGAAIMRYFLFADALQVARTLLAPITAPQIESNRTFSSVRFK
jgi:hypothetical protein